MGRPDILVILLGFTSLFCYLKTFNKESRFRNMYFLTSGLLSGLAFLSHYLAIIFIIALGAHALLFNFKRLLKFSGIYFFLIGLLTPVFLWIVLDFQMFQFTLNNFLLRAQYRANSPNWIWVIFSGNLLSVKLVYIFYMITFWELARAVFLNKTRKNVLLLLLLAFSWIFSYLWQAFYAYAFIAVFTYLSLFYLFAGNSENEKSSLKINTKIYATLLGIFLVLNIFNLGNLFLQFQDENYSYDIYSQALQESIPVGADVYLSAIPDPYFALIETNTVYEFPVLPTSRQDLVNVLGNVDYIVINSPLENIVAGNVVQPYLQKNAAEIRRIGSPDQYQAIVVKLVARDKRVNAE